MDGDVRSTRDMEALGSRWMDKEWGRTGSLDPINDEAGIRATHGRGQGPQR
ncbi:hypothetical protein BDA96_06G047000 [Sorghum bicolor]|uniref:Uncharacterized protein n=2 Tax=Sorghum bicolor TaxID=4558 RepID=A0A921QP35_SORBI|nr:hypothetical protein BDA96_06G047000 [Sorghum bicolor]KXG26025.1 hypothetical protein SORBI_3006G042600 [Sorghum bicolor]